MRTETQLHIATDYMGVMGFSHMALPDVRELYKQAVKNNSSFTIEINRDGVKVTRSSPDLIDHSGIERVELGDPGKQTGIYFQSEDYSEPVKPPFKRGRGRPRKDRKDD